VLHAVGCTIRTAVITDSSFVLDRVAGGLLEVQTADRSFVANLGEETCLLG
jgi:hypothetical protein